MPLKIRRKKRAVVINVIYKQDKPDRPTAMTIYKYLWRARDFELTHLWQRSIFLGAFLLAVAALYAGYMQNFFIPQYRTAKEHTIHSRIDFSLHTEIPAASAVASANRCASLKSHPLTISGTGTANGTVDQRTKPTDKDSLVLHDTALFGLMPIAITLLGLAFSVLWITMAKGSKAWYELYESNIAAISGDTAFWEGIGRKNTDLTDCFDKKIGTYKSYLFGKLENRNNDPINPKLFSVAAGPFSVSKINVMIGIISLTVFLCAFAFHVHWTIRLLHSSEAQYGFLTVLCFIAELITAFFIVFRLKHKVRSSYFDNL